MFYGCSRLVGGTGYVRSNGGGAGICCFGDAGLLTDPADDRRRWCVGTVYADGLLEVSASGAADPARTVLATGRVCVNARYDAVGSAFWYEHRALVERAVLAADMADTGADFGMSLNYWFYGFGKLFAVEGMANLAGVREMRYAFNACTSLATLDLRGFSPAALEVLAFTFGGCSALTTILVDAGWALPSGCGGGMTFYGCTSLVGGNGTIYLSARTNYDRMVIDGLDGKIGYLTAGQRDRASISGRLPLSGVKLGYYLSKLHRNPVPHRLNDEFVGYTMVVQAVHGLLHFAVGICKARVVVCSKSLFAIRVKVEGFVQKGGTVLVLKIRPCLAFQLSVRISAIKFFERRN